MGTGSDGWGLEGVEAWWREKGAMQSCAVGDGVVMWRERRTGEGSV